MCKSLEVQMRERQRIDASELECWRRLLRLPWTARRSNQSILKEISPEYSLEGLMLKLKLQYFGHLMHRMTHWKRPWCWERLKVGGEWATEDEMVEWHYWLSGHEFEQALGDGEGQWSLVCCSPWGCQESDPTEWLNWTDNHITFAKILPHSQSCRSHYMNTQSPHHIWWVKGVFGNSSIFYPCFFTWHIELSIHDYPFQISVALLQPD